MRNCLIKLFLIFTVVLNISLDCFALGNLGITSVIYDNSLSVLAINSNDNEDFAFDNSPKLHVVAEENKAYFDIESAILKCRHQDIILKSGDINEIVVSQFSLNPNIVRIVFYYNQTFNPYNIQLKRINNTLLLKFKNTQINNYYFQTIFQDTKNSDFFETIVIQDKVKNNNEIFRQINSSFGLNNGNNSDYILNDKDLRLKSKYYIDTLNFKNNLPVITGIGSYNLSKPFYLSNPDRVVFDITNTIVNPSLRNKELVFNQNGDSIKIGQFNKNTARIVITTKSPEKYVPVFYPDSQKLAFAVSDATFTSGISLSDLVSTKLEKSDNQNFGIKFVFNKPIVVGLKRTSKILDFYFYNVNLLPEQELKSELKNSPYADFEVTSQNNNSLKLSLKPDNIENLSVLLGSDGKTLRIKEKLETPYTAKPSKSETPVINIPALNPNKIAGKHYVVLDAGHGGSDVGATRNDIYEKDITLDLAQRVEKLLIKKGYIVQMTRTSDKTVSLQDRVDFSEAIAPDIFVSIHVNSSNSETPYGLETHYYKDNSLHLAKCVHASLLNNINSKDRGLFKSKFYVINHTTAPAILVETGFISNPSERAQLVSESRKNATAKAIAEGIDEYFK